MTITINNAIKLPVWCHYKLKKTLAIFALSLAVMAPAPAQAGIRSFCEQALTRVHYKLTAKKRAFEQFVQKLHANPDFVANCGDIDVAQLFRSDGMLKRAAVEGRLEFKDRFFIITMLKKFRGEELGLVGEFNGKKVTYLTEEQLKPLLVTVLDGKLFQNGKPMNGEHIFVMDSRGNIYATDNYPSGVFHHSSFFAGNGVAAAGTFFLSEGSIMIMTAKSGHYEPPTKLFLQAVDHLKSHGVDFSRTELYDSMEKMMGRLTQDWIVIVR